MTNLQEVQGNLLLFDADVLVQQCNCITIKSAGLAKVIAEHYNVNPYAERTATTPNGGTATAETSGVPGTVSWYPVEEGSKFIACLFAQYSPGKSNGLPYYRKICDERNINDSVSARMTWFSQCLEVLANQMQKRQLKRVAFPWGIGCGLAGGSWTQYRALIADWAEKNPDLLITIVKL